MPCNLVVVGEFSKIYAGSIYREGLKSIGNIFFPKVSTKLLAKDYVVYAP
jgi:hypothetical protein